MRSHTPYDINLYKNNGFLFDGNSEFIESLYNDYLKNPLNISEEWRNLFDSIHKEIPGTEMYLAEADHNSIQKKFTEFALPNEISFSGIGGYQHDEKKQSAVLRLIDAYRFYGHNRADIDPLGLYLPPETPELNLSFHGLKESDLEKSFYITPGTGSGKLTLRKIHEMLNQAWCGSIGAEILHLKNSAEKNWIHQKMESNQNQFSLSSESRRELLVRLIAAETLEKYLDSKYQGQKRFSLEGSESLIPLLDEIIRKSGSSPIRKVVMGMSHRGRLNVLVNIIGKSLPMLFREFEDKNESGNLQDSGDVKYHLGYTCNVETPGGAVHISLAANPSHLEFINPVIEGAVRSRQRRLGDKTGDMVLPVLIHGDASFSGQGIIMETLQMTQTQGYTTGGTLHIIVNNQIGFTKSMPINHSFSGYCTEIGKISGGPIFHVNGDNPEAVLFVASMAFDFRNIFKKDVIIDMVCYRRHGHNETDEPRVTQPIMYKKIESHPTITHVYTDNLIQKGIIQKSDINEIINSYRNALEKEERVAPHYITDHNSRLAEKWMPHLYADWQNTADTKIPLERIKQLSEIITRVPENFELHRTVSKIIENRLKMGAGTIRVDWGFAELLAYGSLLQDGFDVRLSGQDTSRGTFFHRHAVIHNQRDGQVYIPLQNLSESKSHFIVNDSLLSEAAVLGFEYGYSIGSPDSLVIWEAQFGDFANGAQVIIDQFITSGETKWKRMCGLVLFLPHGYDGQGPEHSSARLERYLNLAAENNIQICIPSIPSQLFHLLRRQMLRSLRKPLIVLMPKSLLRNNMSTSGLNELTGGYFKNVIEEIDEIDATAVRCIVVCSGKIYFEILKARRDQNVNDIAIIRIEQLYPFPATEFHNIIKQYPNTKLIRWCQEEPENQGAWSYIQKYIQENINSDQALKYIARPASASPAVGYHKTHEIQQESLIKGALNRNFDKSKVKPASLKITDAMRKEKA